jgi:excisionase family DNA binding protein
MTDVEAARYLRMDEHATMESAVRMLRQKAKAGKIRFAKPGRHYLFTTGDCDAYLRGKNGGLGR